MPRLIAALCVVWSLPLFAQNVRRDVPYADPAAGRQVLDVYTSEAAHGQPVVFWIHGGGWQAGDKSDVKLKPQWFLDRSCVFVSTNYRLLPTVDMDTLVRDVAKSLAWTVQHAADFGGDPRRVIVGGHSAGAQLAALLCTDHRYLQAEGVAAADVLIGCVPVDGDTYDIPAIIETAETRRRVHHQPQAKFGHREKFGNDPEKHIDFSAVTHVATDKAIPPFLILYVANHPDNAAQAQRFGAVLAAADVPVTLFAAKNTDHVKLNDDLGGTDDAATGALDTFLRQRLQP